MYVISIASFHSAFHIFLGCRMSSVPACASLKPKQEFMHHRHSKAVSVQKLALEKCPHVLSMLTSLPSARIERMRESHELTIAKQKSRPHALVGSCPAPQTTKAFLSERHRCISRRGYGKLWISYLCAGPDQVPNSI